MARIFHKGKLFEFKHGSIDADAIPCTCTNADPIQLMCLESILCL